MSTDNRKGKCVRYSDWDFYTARIKDRLLPHTATCMDPTDDVEQKGDSEGHTHNVLFRFKPAGALL